MKRKLVSRLENTSQSSRVVFVKPNTVAFIFCLVIVLFFFFLTMNIFFWWNIVWIPLQTALNSQKNESQNIILPKHSRLIDGVFVRENQTENPAVAVMIDNSSDARPHFGLNNASIVYETIAESGITRFLAIFDSENLPETIGPVRSVRPYFIDFSNEWNAILFHSGGSADAMEALEAQHSFHVNEISGDGIYYYRSSYRIMPHNLFTSRNLILDALLDKEYESVYVKNPWKFKDDATITSKINSILKIDFSGPKYKILYEFDSIKNMYKRYLGGEVHITGDGQEIWTKNVIIQQVSRKILDTVGRLELEIVGSGNAFVYRDGIEIPSKWKTQKRRTYFYDLNGQEIEFNRGPIWVEVIFPDTLYQINSGQDPFDFREEM